MTRNSCCKCFEKNDGAEKKCKMLQKGMAQSTGPVVGAPTKTIWDHNPVTHYALQHSTPLPEILQEVLKISTSEKDGGMSGAPEVLSFNMTILHLIQAKKAIDLGVFCGASAVAAALALPTDGRVVAVDTTDEYFQKTKHLLSSSTYSYLLDRIDLRIVSRDAGNAVLDQLLAAGEAETFDFAFIDADKENYLNYYEKCLKLLRPGGVIVIDNALWGGSVLNPREGGSSALIDECNKKIAANEQVNSTLIPIADGMNFIVKRHDYTPYFCGPCG